MTSSFYIKISNIMGHDAIEHVYVIKTFFKHFLKCALGYRFLTCNSELEPQIIYLLTSSMWIFVHVCLVLCPWM